MGPLLGPDPPLLPLLAQFLPASCVFTTNLRGVSLNRAGLKGCRARQQEETQGATQSSFLIRQDTDWTGSKPSLALKSCCNPTPRNKQTNTRLCNPIGAPIHMLKDTDVDDLLPHFGFPVFQWVAVWYVV